MNRKTGELDPLFMVISAPSGAGKTSICQRLLAVSPELKFSVSHTTRPPRPGEAGGRDYFFVSEREFRGKIDRGEFVEWVHNYGRFYGTSLEVLDNSLEEGHDLIIDVEPQGAKKLKERYPGAVFIFILPPSLEELRNRLMKRGYEAEEEIKRRLDKAYAEIKEAVWYDYVVCNDRLTAAVERLHAIYLAEKSRRERMQGSIEAFLKGLHNVC